MKLIDAFLQQPENSPLKKNIDGQIHWHYSLLRKWDKNLEYRQITSKGWVRLVKSVKKNGIKRAFEVDTEGTVYDGNNRLEGIYDLLKQGITTAENGKDLQWVPVMIHRVPETDAEALEIAAVGNGDKDFATWNKDAVANHKDIFEQVTDYQDLVFDGEDAITFGDTFEFYTEDPIITDEAPPTKPKDPIVCPQCSHSFIPV